MADVGIALRPVGAPAAASAGRLDGFVRDARRASSTEVPRCHIIGARGGPLVSSTRCGPRVDDESLAYVSARRMGPDGGLSSWTGHVVWSRSLRGREGHYWLGL